MTSVYNPEQSRSIIAAHIRKRGRRENPPTGVIGWGEGKGKGKEYVRCSSAVLFFWGIRKKKKILKGVLCLVSARKVWEEEGRKEGENPPITATAPTLFNSQEKQKGKKKWGGGRRNVSPEEKKEEKRRGEGSVTLIVLFVLVQGSLTCKGRKKGGGVFLRGHGKKGRERKGNTTIFIPSSVTALGVGGDHLLGKERKLGTVMISPAGKEGGKEKGKKKRGEGEVPYVEHVGNSLIVCDFVDGKKEKNGGEKKEEEDGKKGKGEKKKRKRKR